MSKRLAAAMAMVAAMGGVSSGPGTDYLLRLNRRARPLPPPRDDPPMPPGHTHMESVRSCAEQDRLISAAKAKRERRALRRAR